MRKLINRRELVRRIGKSSSTVDRWEEIGILPQRVRLGPNSVAWYEDEIDQALDNLPRGRIERPEPAIAQRAKRRAELAAEVQP